MSKDEKRKDRHKITQEDFTPDSVVESLLDSLPENTYTNIDKTVLDNSCGIGNLLVGVLKRKLEYCNSIDDGKRALKSIYGVELMADNVEECRTAIYDLFVEHYPEVKDDFKLNFKIRQIIRNRIQWHDSLKFEYNHWPTLRGRTPDKKHMNVSFRENRNGENKNYPMWEEKKEIKELLLFDEFY